MKQKINRKLIESKFLNYVEEKYENSIFEFSGYDSETRQVFFRVEGDWDEKIRKDLISFFKQYNNRISISRILTRVPGEEFV